MARKYRSTDDEFIAAVDGAKSYTEICIRLGLRSGGAMQKSIKKRIEKLGLITPDLIGKQGVGQKPRPIGFFRKSIESRNKTILD